MANVPDESVAWGVKYVVQRHGEFDGAEACCKVTAHLADSLNQIVPKLISDYRKCRFWQRP